MDLDHQKEDDSEHLEDLVELGNGPISWKAISLISASPLLQSKYAETHGDQFFSRLLLSITHKNFAPEQAKELWQATIEHRKQLSEKLSRDPGIIVAILDYLSNVSPELEEPLIIEQGKSEYIASTTTKDELTGLFTRAVLEVALTKEVEQAKRQNRELCLMMIDIDDFKVVNDDYGHLVGDKVLVQVSQTIMNNLREMDMAARFGGEEILVMMPGSSVASSLTVAERVRREISEQRVGGVSVTASIGLSGYSERNKTVTRIIHAADTALYRAKDYGKNQVQQAPD